MGKLLVLFVLVPTIELVLLIELGGRIGLVPTVAVILLTGVVGASLARWQGLTVLRQMQTQMAEGQLPAGAMFDGIIVLLAGALLITPGFLTDIIGFACLVPGIRAGVKRVVQRRIEKSIAQGQTVVIGFKQ